MERGTSPSFVVLVGNTIFHSSAERADLGRVDLYRAKLLPVLKLRNRYEDVAALSLQFLRPSPWGTVHLRPIASELLTN